MLTFSLKSALIAGACGSLLTLAGCKHGDREYDESQNSPQYSQSAVQTPEYQIRDEKGVKYAVLQQGSVISRNLDQWHVVNPEFFVKLSGIMVTPPAEDKTYHGGYGYVVPHIEINPEHPDQKIGRLSAGYLVPKEINGWVAVDQKTLADLVKKFMAQ